MQGSRSSVTLKQKMNVTEWIQSIFRVQGKGGQGNIVALDGVRAIAALMVVTLHLNEFASVPWNIDQNPFTTSLAVFGRTGVDLFFVLSGFLLFLPYAKALLFEGVWPSIRTFYLKRIFRIWPGYYVSLLIFILWYNRQYLQPSHWKELLLFLTFFMDSSHKTFQMINGPFWTLATEWQFYMVLPLIAFCFFWILKRLGAATPRRRLQFLLGCCGGLMLLSLAIRGLGVYWETHTSWTFLVPRPVLNVLLFFLFGVQGKYLEVFGTGMLVSVCYTFAQHPQEGVVLKKHFQRWSNWICRAGFVFLLCLAPWQLVANNYRDVAVGSFSGYTFLNGLTPFYPWLGEPMAGIGYGTCILAILFGSAGLRWFFELPYMRWIGQISYALYMWNQRLISVFTSYVVPHFPHFRILYLDSAMYWIFVFVVVLPLCALFYRLIEEPGIRLGQWVINRKPAVRQVTRQVSGQLKVQSSPEFAVRQATKQVSGQLEIQGSPER